LYFSIYSPDKTDVSKTVQRIEKLQVVEDQDQHPNVIEVWQFVTVFVTIKRRFPRTLGGRDVHVSGYRSSEQMASAQRGGIKS
jgi:hypothetical protein